MAPQLRNILSTIAAVGLLTFGQASDAGASIFYDWSGDCSIGCSGQSSAMLELRDSYEGGTSLRNRDFISFSYSSSGGTFDVPGDANLRRISGSLPSEGSTDGANLFLRFAGFNFQITRENGGWATVFSRAGIYEAGHGSTWSSGDGSGGSVDVPAPASLLALMGALLALAFVWRRREPTAGIPAAV
ncbi:MAG: PEP-CTERM sorting domain-containing protein [Geminicoccaceae bacterium]